MMNDLDDPRGHAAQMLATAQRTVASGQIPHPAGVLDALEQELHVLVEGMNANAIRTMLIADRLLGSQPRPVDNQSAAAGVGPTSLHSISALIAAANDARVALEQELGRLGQI